MKREFFVMLNIQGGSAFPMTTGENNDGVAFYESEDEARSDAENNLLGNAFGFEIFERGTGTCG